LGYDLLDVLLLLLLVSKAILLLIVILVVVLVAIVVPIGVVVFLPLGTVDDEVGGVTTLEQPLEFRELVLLSF
jgi:hypothetical protein